MVGGMVGFFGGIVVGPAPTDRWRVTEAEAHARTQELHVSLSPARSSCTARHLRQFASGGQNAVAMIDSRSYAAGGVCGSLVLEGGQRMPAGPYLRTEALGSAAFASV
eukprot:3823712-Rhodomonas_salina.2